MGKKSNWTDCIWCGLNLQYFFFRWFLQLFGTPNEIVKSYFGSASHVFLSCRLSQWYTGSMLGLFLALDTYIKLKLMLQVYFFVWCGVILWHNIVVKREKTTCNSLNSTIYQELFSMGIICKFQMIHRIIKIMYTNKLFKIGIFYYFFMLCFFFGSLAQLRLIPLIALTDRRNHWQRNELILVGLGNLRFLQVNYSWLGWVTCGSSRLILLVGLGNLRFLQVNPGWAG